jgi:hypothetical protein
MRAIATALALGSDLIADDDIGGLLLLVHFLLLRALGSELQFGRLARGPCQENGGNGGHHRLTFPCMSHPNQDRK